jgi:Leucine-rich repeat (LRR) protein
LKGLSHDVTANLKNLITLDLTQNGLESLEGIESMKRLKRLISKNN